MLCLSTKKDMRKNLEDFLNNQLGIKGVNKWISGKPKSSKSSTRKW